MTREKIVKMYERFISQFRMYVNITRVLLMGYLPISLLHPSKLQEILGEVKMAIQISNPDYDNNNKKITFLL